MNWTDTATVQSVAFERMHPKLGPRGGFKDHQGPPPLIEGTVISEPLAPIESR